MNLVFIKALTLLESFLETLLKTLLKTLLLLFLCVPLIARASSNDCPEGLFFEEIPSVVTPARIPQRHWHAPSTVKVVTEGTIRRWHVRSVADLLRRLGGVDVRKYGRGHHVGPRGTANNQHIINYLVLIDGLPANDPLFGDFDLGPDFPLNMVSRIEFVRGPGSSLYGANAYAGVINIVTKKAEDLPHSLFDTELGPDDLLESSFVHGRPSLERSWALGVRGRFTDGRDRHAVNENDSFRDRDIWFSSRDELRGHEFFAYASNLDQGRPGNVFDDDPDDSIGTSNEYLRARWEFREDRHRSIVGKAYLNEKDGYFFSTPASTSAVEFDTRRIGFNIQDTRDYSSKGNLVLGVEWAGKRARWRDIGGRVSSHESALYVQRELRGGSDWRFTLGARLDYDSSFGSNFSPRFSALREIASGGVLRFSAGRSYRAPNFSEQYIDASISTASFGSLVLPLRARRNPELQPELLTSYELSYSKRSERRFRYSITLYDNHVNNRIGSRIEVPGTYVLAIPENKGSSIARGVELEIERGFSSALNLKGNYTFQRVFDENSGEVLEYAPKHQLNVNLDYRLSKDWYLYWNSHWVSERAGEFSDDLSNHCVHNLSLSYSVGKSLQFALNVYNLSDESYVESDGYPMPERTMTFETRIKF